MEDHEVKAQSYMAHADTMVQAHQVNKIREFGKSKESD